MCAEVARRIFGCCMRLDVNALGTSPAGLNASAQSGAGERQFHLFCNDYIQNTSHVYLESIVNSVAKYHSDFAHASRAGSQDHALAIRG